MKRIRKKLLNYNLCFDDDLVSTRLVTKLVNPHKYFNVFSSLLPTFVHEMININTYHHIKLNKWLLLVTLLFSIFNLSGNVNDYQSQLRQKTQTELLLSSKQKSGYQLISYKKALEHSIFHNLIKYPNISWINTFHFDNITTLEKLKTNLKHCYAHSNAIFFFHSKTFPQSSDEDVFVPFLG